MKAKPTLDKPALYEIKVPGHLNQRWSGWAEGLTAVVDNEGDGQPVTTLTGKLDQAALQAILRRIYALGLPLISVVCVDAD